MWTTMRVLLLLFLLMAISMCRATWFEEQVYKDSKRVVEDDDDIVSSAEGEGLLWDLLSLGRLYDRQRGDRKEEERSSGHQAPAPSSRKQSASRDDDAASVLKSVLQGIKPTPLKRVLPPMGELCRVMNLPGCTHSRHR
ncbi:uncharacterized protein LOC143278077 [Babylonia areolata]|uniref:uncharacterized protein LOC143278077 n=1 Tax=Babylonia areolata TaxID=304850 RepID=UPI003FCF4183